MTGYFDRFPIIPYQIGNSTNNNPIPVRNIFFRLKILDSIKNNSLIYYPYYIQDDESPEAIAYRYYADVTKHWLVLMANNIIDPQFGWPLSYNNFMKYIIGKYGNLETAYSTIHHYEMNIERQNNPNLPSSITTFIIDEVTYEATPGFTFQEINLQDGTTVAITTTTNEIFIYDYENQLNENKKQINLISKQYISQIDQEFQALTKRGS